MKNPKYTITVFSYWKKYSHIIEELHNTNFLVFITGIGK